MCEQVIERGRKEGRECVSKLGGEREGVRMRERWGGRERGMEGVGYCQFSWFSDKRLSSCLQTLIS